MFVTAVCLLFLTRGVICFYEREARARVPAQACYCRSLCHSDVADCWSCLCMFQSGLQHHAESRDHPMYSLSRSLWGWHPKMKIRHQNGRALPHQAETQGLIKQRKNKLCCENNSFTTKVLKPWITSVKNWDKGLCNNYQEGGAEKLELSSKNLDSNPLQNKKN